MNQHPLKLDQLLFIHIIGAIRKKPKFLCKLFRMYSLDNFLMMFSVSEEHFENFDEVN